jgi:hypothetical protein
VVLVAVPSHKLICTVTGEFQIGKGRIESSGLRPAEISPSGSWLLARRMEEDHDRQVACPMQKLLRTDHQSAMLTILVC